MIKENRSLSPHLFCYKPQMTSVISIFHRISGSLLSLVLFYLYTFFIFLISFSNFSFFYSFYLNLYGWFIFNVVFYIVTATVFFHFMNGVRHILWDFCLGLDLNNLFLTGCFVLVGTSFFVFFFIFL